MRISAGCQITYDCPQPTPMLLMLSPHPSRLPDLVGQHEMRFDPAIPARDYIDGFGNRCTRIIAPTGRLVISTRLMAEDPGTPDATAPTAWQRQVDDLPSEMLVWLLGSRYCDTDRMTDIAWTLFGRAPMGWARVQTICDFVRGCCMGRWPARTDP
jgi:transglutaminase-like putative cysteine protease